MKPHLLKVSVEPAHSFSVRKDVRTNINNHWHYHPEVELVYFHKGAGTQFVGDNIKKFNAGEIVLVGSNLPHYWKFDSTTETEENNKEPVSTVVHFFENFWGDTFLQLPESKPLRSLLDHARRGISVSGAEADKTGKMIERLHHEEGLNRVIALIQCLLTIANCQNTTVLSSPGFNYEFSHSENRRINAIYNYTLNNFHQKISLEAIAGIAGMVPNSFCRYFKSRTAKTYSQFLLEIRIGHACKLLMDNNMSIKQLCYESGFNNFSCFHKSFKRITGRTPQWYQKEYLEKRA